ncbi:unnamed protein product, partial [Prorocentrum cordatum]
GVVTAQLDVRDAAAVELFAGRVAQQFGTIDLWINNSRGGGARPHRVPARLGEPAQLEEHLAVNVVGVLNGTRSFVRHVRSREGGGVLLNISSGAARSGYAGWGPYCAGKAAVDRLSECAQLEEERRLASGCTPWPRASSTRGCRSGYGPARSRSSRRSPSSTRFSGERASTPDQSTSPGTCWRWRSMRAAGPTPWCARCRRRPLAGRDTEGDARQGRPLPRLGGGPCETTESGARRGRLLLRRFCARVPPPQTGSRRDRNQD